MAQFETGSGPIDPYRTYKFRLRAEDGRALAGITRAGLPVFTLHAVGTGADAGTDRQSDDPVTLERGITEDGDFARWAGAVWTGGPGAPPPDGACRTLILEVRDLTGRVARAYRLDRCWPSAFEAVPDLDAQGNALAIRLLRLEHAGWEIIAG